MIGTRLIIPCCFQLSSPRLASRGIYVFFQFCLAAGALMQWCTGALEHGDLPNKPTSERQLMNTLYTAQTFHYKWAENGEKTWKTSHDTFYAKRSVFKIGATGSLNHVYNKVSHNRGSIIVLSLIHSISLFTCMNENTA